MRREHISPAKGSSSPEQPVPEIPANDFLPGIGGILPEDIRSVATPSSVPDGSSPAGVRSSGVPARFAGDARIEFGSVPGSGTTGIEPALLAPRLSDISQPLEHFEFRHAIQGPEHEPDGRGIGPHEAGNGHRHHRMDPDIVPEDTSLIVPRPDDGAGSNPLNPDWGARAQTLIRLAPNSFQDGIGQLVTDLPNARLISNMVSAQELEMPNEEGASDFLWAWGQFIDHDLSLTEAGTGEYVPISAAVGDPWLDPGGTGDGIVPFFRVDPNEGTGIDDVRQYHNQITAFIDAGMVYGSDTATVAALRGDGGYLLLQDGLLVETDDGVLAGDVRAAENVALTSLHILFAREHNRLVDEFSAQNKDWSSDDLYYAARMRVEAQIQAITFNEFLPILVGDEAISSYGGYDETVNPGVSLEFSTAAFRFGHSLLSSSIGRIEEDGSDVSVGTLALRDAFFNPSEIRENGGIDPILRGLADGTAQELDARVVDDVRSFLFAEGGSAGLDLAALNIQRGRDLGVATYNDMREALGLERVASFADITCDGDLVAALHGLYGDVDSVDAWVGGLAEDAYGGGMLGELFSTIIIDQFMRIRDGDPFWSQAGNLSEEEIEELWETMLSDVIEGNTDIDAIQDDVFHAYDRVGGTEADDVLSGGALRDLILGRDGDDTLDGLGGDDQIEGGAGDDVITGGSGNDVLSGGLGEDSFFFGEQSGQDRIKDYEQGDEIVVTLERTRDARMDIDRHAFVQQGDDLVLRLTADTTITFEDTSFNMLDLNDFTLV